MMLVRSEQNVSRLVRQKGAKWRLPNWDRLAQAVVAALATGWEFAARDLPGSEWLLEGKGTMGCECDRSVQPRHCMPTIDVAGAQITRDAVERPRSANSNSRVNTLTLLWVGAMVLAGYLVPIGASAEAGSEKEIRIGQTMLCSCPLASLSGVGKPSQAYFDNRLAWIALSQVWTQIAVVAAASARSKGKTT